MASIGLEWAPRQDRLKHCHRTESQFSILQNKFCRIRRRILQNKFCETESCKSEFCRQNPAGRILQNDDEEILQDRILQNTFCKTKFCKTNSVENEPKIRISFRILFINLRSKTHCRMNGDSDDFWLDRPEEWWLVDIVSIGRSPAERTCSRTIDAQERYISLLELTLTSRNSDEGFHHFVYFGPGIVI